MGVILRLIGFSGVVLFGFVFALTFTSLENIEQSAKGFVTYQIAKEVRLAQQAASQSAIAEQASGLAARLGYEKEQIVRDLEEKLPDKIARVVASMCGYDCERQKALSQSIATDYLERITRIQIAEDTLGNIIKGKYIEIVSRLKMDLRIFLGTNFVVFLFLLVLSFVRPQALMHLFLPGILLLISTFLAMCIYLFGQNWFFSILYNDYMGFGYLAYVAVIFGVLSDIAFNGARVISKIVSGVADAVGSSFVLSPC